MGLFTRSHRFPPATASIQCLETHDHSHDQFRIVVFAWMCVCVAVAESVCNRRYFVPYDLEVWRVTKKNNRVPLLCYIKLCASFQSHGWIRTGVTVRQRSIRVKIGDFFVPCDLEIWWMTWESNRAPVLYYIKLCASFQSHEWIQTGIKVQKR